MAASSSPPAAGKRSFGWRYSLRALWLIVTLACLGLWFWYRVPFTKVIDHSQQSGVYWEEKAGPVRMGREVQRFRRTLRDEPIREGLTEFYDREGRRIGEENWREGSLHGPFVRWYTNGNVRSRGQYIAGRMDGIWEHFDEQGQPTLKTIYDDGRPNGDWQQFDNGRVARTIRFEQGEATQIDGQPFNDPLGGAWRLGQIDNKRVADALPRPAEVDYHKTPLQDMVVYLRDLYGIPFGLSRKCRPDLSVSYRAENLTLGSMLVLVCEPHDVAATYRFGMIWVTTKEDAANWVDPTGTTSLLEAPPNGASPLDQQKVRSALEKPAQFDFLDTPAEGISGYLSNTYGVKFVCDNSVQGAALTSSLIGITLQDALGVLCDQHDLRIRWTEGTTLVIERQEEDQPRPRQ